MGGKGGGKRQGRRQGGREERREGGEWGGKTGKGRRGMGGWGWIAEAKLQEKGEPGEQQISAGEGNGVPGEGSCCSCGGGGGRWEPVVPALPAPDLCPPRSSDPTCPVSPSPDVFAPVP